VDDNRSFCAINRAGSSLATKHNTASVAPLSSIKLADKAGPLFRALYLSQPPRRDFLPSNSRRHTRSSMHRAHRQQRAFCLSASRRARTRRECTEKRVASDVAGTGRGKKEKEEGVEEDRGIRAIYLHGPGRAPRPGRISSLEGSVNPVAALESARNRALSYRR